MGNETLDTVAVGQREHASWTATVIVVAGRMVTRPSVSLSPITVVGRTTRSGALALDDPELASLHAEIMVRDGLASIEGWSGRVVEVDGHATSSSQLSHGTVVVLGSSAFVVRRATLARMTGEDDVIRGSSPAISALRRALAELGPTDRSVLVTGERGTGKELVARRLHDRARRSGKLVVVPAVAYEDASIRARAYDDAREGTLVVADVDQLGRAAQRELGDAIAAARVRHVCTTSADLLAIVEAGQFAGELSSRVAEFSLAVPPVRDRREDVFPLLAAALGAPLPLLSGTQLRTCLGYDWPENLRDVRRLARQTFRDGVAATPPPSTAELVHGLAARAGRVTDLACDLGETTTDVYRWLVAAGLWTGDRRF